MFEHECRLPAPRRKAFTWDCRCGQSWQINPCDRETRHGRATGEAAPTRKAVKR